MADLRGGQYLWNAAAVTQGNQSNPALIGPGPYVTLYLTSDTACTLTVECSATADPSAGRNAVGDGSGLTWFPYATKDAPSTIVTIVLQANKPQAIDLSPYGPQFLRLVATTLTGTADITAILSAFGPN